jgi:hypothetical protein
MESAGFDGRLGLNSFIQTGQVYVGVVMDRDPNASSKFVKALNNL